MRPPNQIINHDREMTAEREIGITQFRGVARTLLIVCFLASIIVIPLAQYLLESIAKHEVASSSVRHSPADLQIIDHDAMRLLAETKNLSISQKVVSFSGTLRSDFKNYEKSLEDQSFLRLNALPVIQWIFTRYLGLGNENVYLGREGCLYYRPDVDHVLSSKSITAVPHHSDSISPILALQELHKDLEARGILLLVVPVPVKTMVDPEALSSDSNMITSHGWKEFFEEISDAGISSVDLMAVLEKLKAETRDRNLFLKTDTHWTPEAMQRCAEAISQASSALLGDQVRTNFREESSITRANAGDLAVMLGLPKTTSLYPLETVTLHPVASDSGPWKDDEHADILLMGDSYARIFSADDLKWGTESGLPEHLSLSMGRPIDLLAINSGGANTCRLTLARNSNRLNGKKLLIYEFAARDLTESGWQHIRLKAPTKLDAQATTSDIQSFRTISGTIHQITKSPMPGTTPYNDVLVAIHLTATSDRKECLVFLWGMKGGKLTSVSQLAQGSPVSLHVSPWADVESKYGSINRIEPEGDAATVSDIYWSEDFSNIPDNKTKE
jgi:alginate O-acetyltransferase complex protein AlgJ